MAYDYDVAVIGAGWAGFNAAIKTRDAGLKTCIIEKSLLGGTCLNSGCIPTKALINSAKAYSLAKKAGIFGVEIPEVKINFQKAQERKDKVLGVLRQGIQFMLKGIDVLNLEAQLLSNEEIKAGEKTIKVKNILITSGSRPIEIPGFKFDGKKIISSDDMLNLKDIPRSLLIVGGGVIGCEFASLFSALGVQVTVAEKMPQLLPGEDLEVAKKLENIFKKKGIKVNTGIDAGTLDLNNFELVLVCVGRTPVSSNLGLEKIGVKLERSKILVDEFLKTSVNNIYAAGDCTGKIMLAHYASYQGEIAAHNIAHPDKLKAADNTVVPGCIFTDPEIASVGLDEEKAKAKGIEVTVRKFDFMGSGMARILEETDGFIKVVSDKATDEIIGVVIIGPKATELISGMAIAVSSRLRVSQIRETIFAHPTLSESIHEAIKA